MASFSPEGYFYENGEQAVDRLQSLILTALENLDAISNDDKAEYSALRRFFLEQESFQHALPENLLAPSLKSAGLAYQQRWSSEGGKRRADVTADFGPLMSAARHHEAITLPGGNHDSSDGFTPSSWTGLLGRKERVLVAKQLLPAAQSAVEDLIAGLDKAGHNGGPLLEDVSDAVATLRQLHITLGELLNAIEHGRFNDELGNGLAADAFRFAKRAAESLRDDPVPYAAASMVLAVLTACGFPGAGAFAATATLELGRRGRS